MHTLGLISAHGNRFGFAWTKKTVWNAKEEERFLLPAVPEIRGNIYTMDTAVAAARFKAGAEDWFGLLFVNDRPVLFVALSTYFGKNGTRDITGVRMPAEAILILLRNGQSLTVVLGEPGEVVRTRTRRQRRMYAEERRDWIHGTYRKLRQLYRRIPDGDPSQLPAREHLKTAAALVLSDSIEVAVDAMIRATGHLIDLSRQVRRQVS